MMMMCGDDGSDREGGGGAAHSILLAAKAAGALLGDDVVADFGYAEDERGAGEGAEGAYDPDDGEGEPNVAVIVGWGELGDCGGDACGCCDHFFDPSVVPTSDRLR